MSDHTKRTRSPVLTSLYHEYLVDQNTDRFAQRVAERYQVGTLERLAVVGDRMGRRAAVLAVGLLGDYGSNSVLGRALHDADRGVRMLAENGIRYLWCRAGSALQQQALTNIIAANTAKRFGDVITEATRLIGEAPWIAEAWNQRALALFGLGRFAESIHDCTEALEINPYHFGAVVGMAQCHLQAKAPEAALQCFRRALRLNPNLEGVRAQVLYLQRTLKSQE